jgi:hypothetical protein
MFVLRGAFLKDRDYLSLCIKQRKVKEKKKKCSTEAREKKSDKRQEREAMRNIEKKVDIRGKKSENWAR